MNRLQRRARRRPIPGHTTGASPVSEMRGAREIFEAIEAAVPEWCAAIRGLGGELKDYCVTITPAGDPYVWTRTQTIEALTKLGRTEVAAAVRRASSNPDELLIVGVKATSYMTLYGRDGGGPHETPS